MGLTKQYLRWEQVATWGLITTGGGVTGSGTGGASGSTQAATFLELDGTKGRYVATPACENIVVWDTKTSEKRMIFGTTSKTPAEVTCVLSFTDSTSSTFYLAAGRQDGSLDVFNYANGDLLVTFQGHKSAVNCLAFDSSGMRLVSGGKDTEIVIWDILNECGLFRLRGHKGPVTCVSFMQEQDHANFLVSSSKDMLVKFWDVTTQHCFNTIVGHRSEVWNLALLDSDSKLITGASDSELKVWSISFNNDSSSTSKSSDETVQDQENDDGSPLNVTRIGSLIRQSTTRTAGLVVDSSERLLVCHGTDSILEVFRIRTTEEALSVARKRTKKDLKRLKRTNPEADSEELPQDVLNDSDIKISIDDQFERFKTIKASSRIRGCHLTVTKQKTHLSGRIILSLANNIIELLNVNLFKEKEEITKSSIKSHGHRSDIRALTMSNDSQHVLSVSADSLRLWSRTSGRQILSIEEGIKYPLDCAFAPNDRYALVSSKDGFIQIFDLSSATLVRDLQVSDSNQPIWSITSAHKNSGLISGCEDKLVKFFDYEMSEDDTGKRVLSLAHKRTLKLDEGVLCVRQTPDGRLVAVALLDSTVKVFFNDTLNFFLSLYGHKLPVLSMDISSDSTLIATGSSDKNIKIWGLDFGDCHKSIFAHNESIMAVKFLPKTHYLFTAGKDKLVRLWDADHFQKICDLTGHHAEIWTMVVSKNGKSMVTASRDKSIRVWQKTEEILVLEDEQETEREEAQEKEALAAQDEAILPGHTDKEVGLAQKRTHETLVASEKLIEAIDVFKCEYTYLKNEHKGDESSKHEPHPLIGMYGTGKCPYRFMLETLRRISSTQVEEAILTLPFSYVIDLIHILPLLLDRKWDPELLCRYATYCLQSHYAQIVANPSLTHPVGRLRTLMQEALQEVKDCIGLNMGALHYYMTHYSGRDEVTLFADSFAKLKENKKSKKKRLANQLHTHTIQL